MQQRTWFAFGCLVAAYGCDGPEMEEDAPPIRVDEAALVQFGAPNPPLVASSNTAPPACPALDLGDQPKLVSNPAASGPFYAGDISDCGRHVVFHGSRDVYRADLVTSVVENVNVTQQGTPANRRSRWPAISGDGDLVAFQSVATNLAPFENGVFPSYTGYDFMYLRSPRRNLNLLASRNDTQPRAYSTSLDGRFGGRRWFVFNYSYHSLDPAFSADANQSYLWDLHLNTLEMVGLDSSGSPIGALSPAVSADGRYVVFKSSKYGVAGIYRRDRATGISERMDVDSSGQPIAGFSNKPYISGNGKFGLVGNGPSNTCCSVLYLRDFDAQSTSVLTTDGRGADISFDGRFVTYVGGDEPRAVSPDSNGKKDVLVFDRENGVYEVVTQLASDAFYRTSITADGQWILFSTTDALSVEDADGSQDPYVVRNPLFDGGPGQPPTEEPVPERTASFDAKLGVPRCNQVGRKCISSGLLNGRASLGPEPNQPNTLDGCADATWGKYHYDESLDALTVFTPDGSAFAAGRTVRVEAKVWAWSTGSNDYLDLYYATNPALPNWQYIATVRGTNRGENNLGAEFVLPRGVSQVAVRGQWRYGGGTVNPGACKYGSYTDRDDLVFTIDN